MDFNLVIFLNKLNTAHIVTSVCIPSLETLLGETLTRLDTNRLYNNISRTCFISESYPNV